MKELYEQTQVKNQAIRDAGYNLIEVWECMLAKDKDFQKFKNSEWDRKFVEPLNPRDAFCGGCTNATKLLYQSKENECGRYVDFLQLISFSAVLQELSRGSS